MNRGSLLAGAWILMALAAAPLVLYLVFVVAPHGGVGVPLTPAALNHTLTQWAASFGTNLANRIGGG